MLRFSGKYSDILQLLSSQVSVITRMSGLEESIRSSNSTFLFFRDWKLAFTSLIGLICDLLVCLFLRLGSFAGDEVTMGEPGLRGQSLRLLKGLVVSRSYRLKNVVDRFGSPQ